MIFVVPSHDLVLVHLMNTDGMNVAAIDATGQSTRLGQLLKLILDAAPARPAR